MLLLFLPCCREVRARGRGGAHPHATTVAAAVHTQKGGMQVALSRTDIGLLAQPESVLALAPPAAPSAGLASLWRGRWSGGAPFCFSFLFPSRFSSPLLVGKFTLSRRRFASTSRQWATILAQVLANSYLTKVESSLQRVSLKRQPAQGPAA